jgi:hypothetical protein
MAQLRTLSLQKHVLLEACSVLPLIHLSGPTLHHELILGVLTSRGKHHGTFHLRSGYVLPEIVQ